MTHCARPDPTRRRWRPSRPWSGWRPSPARCSTPRSSKRWRRSWRGATRWCSSTRAPATSRSDRALPRRVIVAVTGATGFVGRHLVDPLRRRGHAVRALVRDPARARWLGAGGGELVPGDVRDPPSLRPFVEGADAAIHLVGIIVERGRQTFAAVHVAGTEAVHAAARAAGVRRFVHMSAVGARPEAGATPHHPTKWQGQEPVPGPALSQRL